MRQRPYSCHVLVIFLCSNVQGPVLTFLSVMNSWSSKDDVLIPVSWPLEHSGKAAVLNS